MQGQPWERGWHEWHLPRNEVGMIDTYLETTLAWLHLLPGNEVGMIDTKLELRLAWLTLTNWERGMTDTYLGMRLAWLTLIWERGWHDWYLLPGNEVGMIDTYLWYMTRRNLPTRTSWWVWYSWWFQTWDVPGGPWPRWSDCGNEQWLWRIKPEASGNEAGIEFEMTALE